MNNSTDSLRAGVHSAPAVNRILETSLYVSDLMASRDFYMRLFGFEVMLEDDRMVASAVPGRQLLLLFRRGGSTLASSTPYGAIPPHDGQGTQHLCFSIAHDSLPQWEAHLHACGTALESKLVWPQGGVSLYFRDLDGHSLEIGTSGLWRNDPID